MLMRFCFFFLNIVITTQYILDKYKDKPPSLTLHMHPTHFRFDQQDGTFNYNSAMRSILEYIAQETIPADAVEVFRDARLPFYEGRLIVHIHDHRTAAKDADGAPTKPKNDMLFSLNRWNEHLTPSPFVPYPAQKSGDVKEEPVVNGDTKPMDIDPSSKMEDNKRVFKTVLHPTPASLHAEICLLAITPALPPNARGRNASVVQTPATPATAHPLTVSTATNTKLPTILNDKTSLTFEADYLLTTGPSLVLTPAESPEHAAAIIEALAHPLHSRPVPPKKTRKRTVKEMAVDEAKAAEEERLMLIMDERHQPSAIGAADDGPVGTGGFEPSFKRWKALESIKQKHEEDRIKKEQEKRQQQEEERRKLAKEQRQEAPIRTPVSATPVEQSPLDNKGSLRDMIARNGAIQQAQQREREQLAQQQAAAQAQAQAAAAARQQQEAAAAAATAAQAAQAQAQAQREAQAREQQHAAQVAAQAQAQAHAAAAAAQTPTSAPQQTSATQGSPIAAASSPFAHQGSPPMPARTSTHSSQPGSRQQSPHMSTVQSIQHQHNQPMPGSPAMHASPMMRVATSQPMHGSPAMAQGSPLARNVGMMPGQHVMTPAMAHQMMMAGAARNPMVMNKAAHQMALGQTPDQQKAMMQRAFLLRQQQVQQHQQLLAAQHAAAQQHQQPQMMDGMGGVAGMHPGMAGRGFMGGMAGGGGMHMNNMMGGVQMMNGYPQMMVANGMNGGGMPIGMMNGAALQGYSPAQINMIMAARGRGQPPQGQ
ncbi:Transcription factor spt20, variant 2 [Arthrobotrys megalospora]